MKLKTKKIFIKKIKIKIDFRISKTKKTKLSFQRKEEKKTLPPTNYPPNTK